MYFSFPDKPLLTLFFNQTLLGWNRMKHYAISVKVAYAFDSFVSACLNGFWMGKYVKHHKAPFKEGVRLLG